MTYDNAFMTVDQAQNVLESQMLAWYSGASRMDAGLTLAEQLATIANEHDPASDRNLIVCVVGSSLPIQNYKNINYIRTDAVKAAAKVLKEHGATIFALGDYHNSCKNLAADTLDAFEATMTSICGNNTTSASDKADYFFSLSKSGSITAALNEMVTKISLTVANGEMVNVDVTLPENISNKWKDTSTTWQQWLATLSKDTEAIVAYYQYTYLEDWGMAYFDENEPYAEFTVPLNELLQEDGSIQYTAQLIPISGEDGTSPDEVIGNNVVITIATPVTITYQWNGDAPDDVTLPEPEFVSSADGFMPKVPQTEDSHYQFSCWSYNDDGSSPISGPTSPLGDQTLYGTWIKYSSVTFYDQIVHSEDEEPSGVQWIQSGTEPSTYKPKQIGYKFVGWYTDMECTNAYESEVITADISLYAKWEASEDVDYTLLYYQQNLNDDQYTEVIDDAEYLYGTTGSSISIAKTYAGFTQSKVTYEATNTAAQTTALPIQADGSLVVSVYYDRDTYTVTYDLNGGTGATGVSYDAEMVKYGTTVTAKTAPTKTGYSFAGWKLGETVYPVSDIIEVTDNLTLTAQWTPNTYTVQFDANAENATGEMADLTLTYDQEGTLTKNAYTRAGYTFTGWEDGDGATYSDENRVRNLTAEKDETATLYAQWAPIASLFPLMPIKAPEPWTVRTLPTMKNSPLQKTPSSAQVTLS
jgi:uncharacterized repeat protein (TIGR02543 family)